jgi:SNF2 family DNA or RNA helicase
VALDFAIHGELHADGATLILFGAGNIEKAIGYLQLMTPHFGPTDPPGGLQAPVHWATVVQLASLGPAWVPGPRLQAWMLAQTQRRIDLAPLTVEANAGAPGRPRSYQEDGARMIAAVGSALICDDPGTGKTLTTLLGLMQLRADGTLPADRPILVVAPNSVVDNWVREAHTWTDFRAKAWRGSATARRRLLQTRGHWDVYVVGYGTVAKDADPHDKHAPLFGLDPGAVVVDECHWVKNPNAVRTKAVTKLCHKADVVIPLSGTPITHHTGDLHPILRAMSPAAYPSRERFLARYLDSVPGDYSDTVLGINVAAEPEFRASLAGQYRHLAKADVLAELPPKVYSVRRVTLPAGARKAYNSMRDDMIAEMDNGDEMPAMNVMTQLLRLLQLACASADVTTTMEMVDTEYGPEERERVHVHLREPSWKVDEFMDVLDERPGKQVLAFAPSRQLMVLCGERAAKEGYRVGYIIGGQSPAERTAAVDAFQAGELDVMCATTQAGGVGLTLTAASTVCFVQRPWSFVEASQAEDRAHRMGSEIHESIEIVDIVAVDTIDSQVRSVLRGKSEALAELLQDPRIAAQCLGGRGSDEPVT